MLEELALLIKLQKIDNELGDIEAEKGDLPEQVERLKNEVAQYKSQIENIDIDRADIETQRSEQMSIVEAAREQMKKSQSVIFSVKTTREYDAISAEIDQSKQRISDAERKQLESMERDEELENKLDEIKQMLIKVEADFKDRQSEMQDRLESTQDEELKLNHEREKIVVRLKLPVYNHYIRISKIRDGEGISTMTDSACGYCFSKIPPQRQVEIKRMDDIILCEVCGCIIVVETI
ncbi:hypothetical protein HQ587_05055 [bacterium]|nr:hypothetical protein [bacterium]